MVLLQNRLGPHTKKRRKKEKKTTLRQSTCHGADMQELESGTEGEAEGGGREGVTKGSRRKRTLCWEQTVRGGHVRTHMYAEDSYIR
jgi:hypothetical protein